MQAMRATCTPPEIYFTCGGCRHLILALMGCNNVDTCLNRPNCTRLLEGIASRSLPLCSHTSCMSLDNSARAGFTSGCLTFCAASDFLVFCHIEWPASRPNTNCRIILFAVLTICVSRYVLRPACMSIPTGRIDNNFSFATHHSGMLHRPLHQYHAAS